MAIAQNWPTAIITCLKLINIASRKHHTAQYFCCRLVLGYVTIFIQTLILLNLSWSFKSPVQKEEFYNNIGLPSLQQWGDNSCIQDTDVITLILKFVVSYSYLLEIMR